MKRPARIALVAVATLIGAGVVATGVGLSKFDPDVYKPDIAAAVKRATGRDLALNGKIGLKFSLTPTIQVSDVTFSDPPGFSRPQMATVQGMELQFALLPLLSGALQIDRLLLIRPDILLETNNAGEPNWKMTPQVAPAAPAGTQAPSAPGRPKTAISVAAIRIQDGTLAYRDDATGAVTLLGLPKLDASADSADSPMHVETDATYNGTAFNLVADTGALTRLQDAAATTPWPVKLALTVGSAKLAAEGTMTRPLRGKGYDLAVNGAIPDLVALAPLLPGAVLPPLHDVDFVAKAADKGGKLPDISALKLHVGASDLSSRAPGLTVASLDVDAPAADQPAKITAAGQFDNAPLSIDATLGAPAILMPDAKPAPFPIDARVQAAGAVLTAKGRIADAKALSGADIVLTAQIPDLSALSPLARRPLPAIKQIAFQGSVTDAPGGFRDGAALHAMTLTSADGDLAGDASLGLRPRRSLTAVLKSGRLDLDALFQAPAPAAAPPPDAATQAPPPKRRDRLFSDQPLPFDALRGVDANIALDIATLHRGGADTKAVSLHAGLADGKLDVDRFAADLPGGRLSGSLTADAGQPAPQVHLVLHAPGLALKTILEAVHEPSVASGNLEILADLSGAGDNPHAIAASLDGSLGLAVAGGTIDNRLLGSLLGKVMDSLNALDLVGKGGTSELKCFAARMEAKHGDATVQPLVLSSSLLTMTGGGTVNLGSETLAMTLRPQVRVAGTGLVVPLAVTGPIRDPAVAVNRIGAAEANVGTVAGAVIGDATPIGVLGGLFGADKLLGGKGGDICAPALALARGQPVPAEAAPAKTTEPSLANPGAALKSLFR